MVKALTLGLTCIGLFTVGAARTHMHSPSIPSQGSEQAAVARNPHEDEAIDEAPTCVELSERVKRAAKNARYNDNGHGQDLTKLAPGSSRIIIGCGLYDPTIFPTNGYDVVILGKVSGRQPYLNANNTAVYTEFEFDVEEALKSPAGGLRLVDQKLVVNRPGGVLRLRTGQVIADLSSGTDMPRPLDVGARYVVFLRRIHDGHDLTVDRAFEIRDGRAYLLGEHPGRDLLVSELPGAVPSLAEEVGFLEAVREAVAHPNSSRHFSAPRE